MHGGVGVAARPQALASSWPTAAAACWGVAQGAWAMSTAQLRGREEGNGQGSGWKGAGSFSGW